MDTQLCLGCNQQLPTEQFRVRKGGRNAGYLMRLCNSCDAMKKLSYNENNPEKVLQWARDYRERLVAAAEAKLADWLVKTNIPFKLMSEQQWLEACSYFDGCAICGDDHIETRQYFINFKDGGKYTAWNMFPMCGKCSVVTKTIANPFMWLDRHIRHETDLNLTEERAKRLVEYLELQIEKAGIKDVQ